MIPAGQRPTAVFKSNGRITILSIDDCSDVQFRRDNARGCMELRLTEAGAELLLKHLAPALYREGYNAGRVAQARSEAATR